MPKSRLPKELWREKRKVVWLRDGGRCQSPPGKHKQFCTGQEFIALNKCHIDHIHSGKLGSNALDNLRVLCPECHALRLDHRHQGLTAKLVAQGKIPASWRQYVWD